MKMNLSSPIIFLCLLLLVTQIACIGKIDDKNPEITKGTNQGVLILDFKGIVDAEPIADTKVELFFYPASGDQKDITYIISFDGSADQITVDGANLRPDYRGLLKYTYTGLDIDSRYFFRIQATDKKTGAKSYNGEFRIAKTFLNVTADFKGIASIKNLSGYEGLTSVKVSWPEATILGSTFSPKEPDAREYILVTIEADQLAPSDFDNESFQDPVRKEYRVAATKVSMVANGLKPNTRYYGRVRALHHGYYENADNTKYKFEINSDYIEFSTLNADLASLKVDLSAIRATSTGENSIDVQWGAVEGAIDHFRIYYNRTDQGNFETYKNGKETSCAGPEVSNPLYFCQKESAQTIRSKVVDLDPFNEYEMNVLICQDPSCTNFLQYDRKTVNTNLQIISFSGVSDIILAKSLIEMDSLHLKYEVPDLASGNCDGLLIEAKLRTTGVPLVDTVLNHPLDANNTNLIVNSFDFQTDDEVKISGIDYSTNEPYCFSVYPYIWKNGGIETNKQNEVIKCILPKVVVPNEEEFVGITDAAVDNDTGFSTVRWEMPIAGLYTHFALFLKTGSGEFNFGDAIASHHGYSRILLPPWQLEYTFILPPGSYSVGILAYCELINTYSVFNSSTNSFIVE